MNEAEKYAKLVEWSDEDQCFVGSCPGLFYGGCHGDDEQAVFAELCRMAADIVKVYESEGRPLPPAIPGHQLAKAIVNGNVDV
jgi:predicted RNase H-like HicB family nuclease